MQKKKVLVLIVSGKQDKIRECFFKNEEDVNFIKASEKIVAEPKKILAYIKEKKYNEFYFATDNVKYQKFKFAMQFYSLLSNTDKSGILDEFGNYLKFKYFNFFFMDCPKFLVSILLSIYYIVKIYIKLPILSYRLKRL